MIKEIIEVLFEISYTLSLKPLRRYLKECKERGYWKDKDLYNTRADNF